MFYRLIHCDWSVDGSKRWLSVAERNGDGWHVSEVREVGEIASFLDLLLEGGPTLAGFDFPIGLPRAYGEQTKLADFKWALPEFGKGEWVSFFDLAEQPEQVSLHRPFYPKASSKGSSRHALVSGLRVAKFEELLRVCERATADRRAACSVFWTLGGNQVGRGAGSGWLKVIRPALERGAALWPFDGSLAALAGRVVLAETYPAEAYAIFGGFRRAESKRNQAHRRSKSDAIFAHAASHGLRLSDGVTSLVQSGFGPAKSGEDSFDAFAGLLLMIEVVDGRRGELRPLQPEAVDPWEGWILGA